MGNLQRRRLVRGAAAAAVGFMGPWQARHAWARARQKKPLPIGLTTDDTGQYAASGQDEQRGIRRAIAGANGRGGVLGRRHRNTNSSSPTEAGKDCHRVKLVWDGNGTNFSTSVVRDADDIFRIIDRQRPQEVADQEAPRNCRLEPLADTPSHET